MQDNSRPDAGTRRQRIIRGVSLAASVALAMLVAGGSLATSLAMRDAVTYGPAIAIGDGTARVYLQVEDGAPVELGVALTEAALEGLPHHHSPGGVEFPDGHRMFEQILKMPSRNPTRYEYVALGWNPGGHEPPGIYDLPHFDFHFYNAPLSQRSAMDPARPEFDTEAATYPADDLVPAGYAATPGAIAFMGAHWVDPASPELNGQTFERTFIYGSWNGEIIFAEPMITRAFLQTKPDLVQTVPVAARHVTPGWYPGSYRVRWVEDAREYHIALTDFAWRN